jgi:hypothetical protein
VVLSVSTKPLTKKRRRVTIAAALPRDTTKSDRIVIGETGESPALTSGIEMNAKHTSGPWYADEQGRIWRRPPSELYQNGGAIAGDKPLAIVQFGWSGEGEVGYPLQANAKLIAAAPELLAALKEMQRTEMFFADHPQKQAAYHNASDAIAKATGEKA